MDNDERCSIAPRSFKYEARSFCRAETNRGFDRVAALCDGAAAEPTTNAKEIVARTKGSSEIEKRLGNGSGTGLGPQRGVGNPKAVGLAYSDDLFVAEPAKSLVPKLKVLASFRGIVARLGAGVQRRPPLKGLALEINAESAIFSEQNDLPAGVSVTAVNGLRAICRVFAGRTGLDGKDGYRQGSLGHNTILNAKNARKVAGIDALRTTAHERK